MPAIRSMRSKVNRVQPYRGQATAPTGIAFQFKTSRCPSAPTGSVFSSLNIALHFVEQILNGIQTIFRVVDFQQLDFVFFGERQQVGQLIG